MVNLLLNSGASLLNGKPIVFLTQWKLMGNSEVHGNEIWSCGEYNATDGKYHILVQPLGGSIADIALDEPLRKVNDVVDSIEFADNVAILTRNFAKALLSDVNWYKSVISSGKYRYDTSGFKNLNKPIKPAADNAKAANVLCSIYDTISANKAYTGGQVGISVERTGGKVYLYDSNYDQEDDIAAFKAHIQGAELIYELATPITETIQVPQIAEADSYICVISQGAKAVEWSSFET